MAAEKKKVRVDATEERTERIKRLVVIALFSDDELMQRFVLKGGNAMDLVFKVGTRASVDIDLSMESDFKRDELVAIRQKLEKNLRETFVPEGYVVFDVSFDEKPDVISPEIAGFWGGYYATFKLIEVERHAECGGDLDKMRRNAVRIGAKGKFEIDISKFEYCRPKVAREMDGFRIFVYTPEMQVLEKLRAICQQMPDYGPIVHRGRPGTARARDFVDIQRMIEEFSLQMAAPENLRLLQYIFEAKRVPVSILERVGEYREFHRPDFQAVRDSVKPGVTLEDFDFYFDFVVAIASQLLKALGNV